MSDVKASHPSSNRPPSPDYRKKCTLCHKKRDVLVRCQIDPSGTWHFVCPGSCWRGVSGGVVDGDQAAGHLYYRYGGMWKNKHEAISAKKPKKAKKPSRTQSRLIGEVDKEADTGNEDRLASSNEQPPLWHDQEARYTKNDQVQWDNSVWICRKSHTSQEGKTPTKAYQLWKEQKGATAGSG